MEAMIDCDDGFEFEIERVDDFIDCPFDEMNDDDDDDDDDEMNDDDVDNVNGLHTKTLRTGEETEYILPL